MIIEHWRDAPWDSARWPNFKPQEVACHHCGEFFFDEASLDAIQAVREALGRPIRLNSAHRCAIHNARIGGAPLSQHKRIAFDISLQGHDRLELLLACREAGFRGFGYYGTFLHVDMGPCRHWYSKAGKKLWTPS